MIPLFLPVRSPQQWSVYQNVQCGLRLVTNSRHLMYAVQTVTVLLMFSNKSAATQENTSAVNREQKLK